jgi:2',3'-cyclic-nucleotide 2'-phosphodiesterase (5'-nucleotidase family)
MLKKLFLFMYRTFSLSVLITYLLIAPSCKSNYFPSSVTQQNISIDEQINTIDSALVREYLPYKVKLEADMNRVISVCDADMVKNKPESGLTNLLADLLLEEGTIEAQNKSLNLKPDISFFNYGGIRTGLVKGNVTVGKVFEIMPFENEMVFVQLTGNQLQQFFDGVAQRNGDSVGGVRFKISGEKATDILISGKPLDPGGKYWLVTNDYVANGGDENDVMKQRLDYIVPGMKIRDAIIRYFETKQKAGETIKEKTDGRISHA